MNLNGTGFTSLRTFGPAGPNEPLAPLAVSGSSVYGTTFGFGPETRPSVYSNSAISSSTNWGIGTSNGYLGTGLTGVIVGGTKLYGTAGDQLYSVNTDGTNLHTVQTLPGSSSRELTLVGSTLFGAGSGVAFSVDTSGNNMHTLHTFVGGANDGSDTVGTMILSSLGTLVGTTRGGGQFGGGTVFEMQTDGSGFHLLHSFGAPGDAGSPDSEIVQLGNNIYGVTDSGAIFALTVPEPSTYALAMVGVVALLAFRRRKALD